MDEPKKRRKHRKPSEADVGAFLRQYVRKRRPNGDPNDRHYSRKVEKKIRALNPVELDQILRDDSEPFLRRASDGTPEP